MLLALFGVNSPNNTWVKESPGFPAIVAASFFIVINVYLWVDHNAVDAEKNQASSFFFGHSLPFGILILESVLQLDNN